MSLPLLHSVFLFVTTFHFLLTFFYIVVTFTSFFNLHSYSLNIISFLPFLHFFNLFPLLIFLFSLYIPFSLEPHQFSLRLCFFFHFPDSFFTFPLIYYVSSYAYLLSASISVFQNPHQVFTSRFFYVMATDNI